MSEQDYIKLMSIVDTKIAELEDSLYNGGWDMGSEIALDILNERDKYVVLKEEMPFLFGDVFEEEVSS